MAESKTFLPEDMLLEILYRLPVKTLIRFTCVCNQWLSLIRSPDFATKQLAATRSKLYKNNFQYYLTATPVPSLDGGVNQIFASLFSYNTFVRYAKFKCSPCLGLAFSDPCDGILCVHVIKDELDSHYEDSFILWNPATREVVPLPYPLKPPIPLEAPYTTTYTPLIFGFGYDPSSDDYKVFVIFSPGWSVEVFSLHEGSWKFLPANSFDESMCIAINVTDRPLLNGKMCSWLNGYHLNALISFDLSDEAFFRTPLNNGLQNLIPRLLQSNKVDSKPCVMVTCNYEDHPDGRNDIEIWELAEYGPSGYWSKKIVIEFQFYETVNCPLGYWLDDETLILQHFTGRDENNHFVGPPLLSYDASTKQLKSTGFEKTYELILCFGYIESLVSVKERCQQHNAVKHQQHDDLGPVCILREVDGPAVWVNSFSGPCVSWSGY